MTLPISGGVTWRFEDAAYVRYRGSEVQQVLVEVDGESSPLTRDTLIIIVVNQKSAGYTDGNGADVPAFDVIGGGDLYVLHAGEVIEGTWFRASQASGYVFTDGDGVELSVPSGSTYLGIVPDSGRVEVGG